MRRLYEKKEILFAVLWIVVYCIVLGTIRGNFGDESICMLIALLVFTAVIIVFVKKNHLEGKYGLTGWPKDMKKYLGWFRSIISGHFIGDSGIFYDPCWLCGRNDLQGFPFQGNDGGR